jgi:hypothetical protein
LNATSIRFMTKTRCGNEPPLALKVLIGFHPEVRSNTTKIAPAIATVTAGPASDTQNSCHGSSGTRSRRDTPPIGNRVMSLVAMPYRRAASAWPNS